VATFSHLTLAAPCQSRGLARDWRPSPVVSDSSEQTDRSLQMETTVLSGELYRCSFAFVWRWVFSAAWCQPGGGWSYSAGPSNQVPGTYKSGFYSEKLVGISCCWLLDVRNLPYFYVRFGSGEMGKHIGRKAGRCILFLP
jgi:hypothetical protein